MEREKKGRGPEGDIEETQWNCLLLDVMYSVPPERSFFGTSLAFLGEN